MASLHVHVLQATLAHIERLPGHGQSALEVSLCAVRCSLGIALCILCPSTDVSLWVSSFRLKTKTRKAHLICLCISKPNVCEQLRPWLLNQWSRPLDWNERWWAYLLWTLWLTGDGDSRHSPCLLLLCISVPGLTDVLSSSSCSCCSLQAWLYSRLPERGFTHPLTSLQKATLSNRFFMIC